MTHKNETHKNASIQWLKKKIANIIHKNENKIDSQNNSQKWFKKDSPRLFSKLRLTKIIHKNKTQKNDSDKWDS